MQMRCLGFKYNTDPDEDEHFGVADSVLALGDSDHGELRRTGTSLHQITYLRNRKEKKGESTASTLKKDWFSLAQGQTRYL